MEDQQLEELRSKNTEKVKSILEDFNRKNSDLFNFSKFHTNGQWHALWRSLFDILNDDAQTSLHALCLNTVRILTRDEFSLQTEDIEDDLSCLLKLAHLMRSEAVELMAKSVEEVDLGEENITPDPNNSSATVVASVTGTGTAVALDETTTQVIAESLKCICNLVFQSSDCRRQCVKSNVTDAVLKRIACSGVNPSAVQLFDMKLLFLLTAMEPDARNRVQIELNGTAYMTEWLDEKMADAQKKDEETDLLCEMLKVMFNITTNPDKSPNECEIQSRHLTRVMRNVLLRFGEMSNDRERNVVMNSINLLTNMPTSCLTELITKCDPSGATTSRAPEAHNYEGFNVRVLDIILNYLRAALNAQEKTASSTEPLSPILTVLVKCVRADRIMRRYTRSVVLPPLCNVYTRPEVGDELRNHLCRFLTSPNTLIRDLAAELLFICCKENVGRMVKYTGYGNAAGLFAKRGLLGGRQVDNSEYSSDSEDSDTEEYKKLQDKINPVLGCYESPKKNPLEGMSEEQKEYEAVQLANLMDKLHKDGIIQPCRIGEDGKPQPVDHILELQEDLPQQQADQKRKS